MRAAADDDDVVVLLQRAGPLQDLLAEEDVLHAAAPERIDADRAAAEGRGAVDRDLPEVVAELLGADDPVAAVALQHVAWTCATSPPDGKWWMCVSRRSTVSASGPTIAITE